MLPNRTSALLTVLIVFFSTQGGKGITYKDNRYDLNIALSEYALSIPANERQDFIQKTKDIVTQASQFLFEVTDYRMYFGTVNILIPPTWTTDLSNIPPTPTTAFSYATADIRFEETKTADDNVIDYMKTVNPKQCGQPGDHILVPPQFITSPSEWADKYGDRVKSFINEFARFRYGVFEEYGLQSEENKPFPYSFKNVRGHTQLTGCNNTEILGNITLTYDRTVGCQLGEPNCRFFPIMDSYEGPTTSLMFMHFLHSTNKFCDESTHDKTSPNRQNHFCRNRSVKTVMEGSRDFRAATFLNSSTITTPTFNIVVPAAQVVYVIFDVSTHDTPTEAEFNYAKDKAANLVDRLAQLSTKVLMGIGTMGSAFNEAHPIIQVQGNVASLKSALTSINRNETQLNIEKGMLEVGKKMTPFAHLSGSIVLFFKFNGRTGTLGNVYDEPETLALLNSRSTRLLTFELLKTTSGFKSLERVSLLTKGEYHFATNQDYNNAIDSVINSTVALAGQNGFNTYRNRRVTLTIGSAEVTSTSSLKSYVRHDYTPADLEVNFYVPKDATGYNIMFNNNLNLSSPEHTQKYLSWKGDYKIHTFQFTPKTSSNHSYEVTTMSSTPLEVFVEAAEILSGNAPLHLGGGGLRDSKPVEVEITTTGDNGLLNLGTVSAEDVSFLIYASVKKGGAVALKSQATALVHFPTGERKEVLLHDSGTYPDLQADDGVYSGLFRPDAVSNPTTYAISAHIRGFTRSNVPVRSLTASKEIYCCGPLYNEDVITTFYQRYIPYAATLQVVGANLYKERPIRITDLKVAKEPLTPEVYTLTWTNPNASYGAESKVDHYKLAYGEDSTAVIDNNGFVPTSANLVVEEDLLNGTLVPGTPGQLQTIQLKLNRTSSSPPLYFTISSLKNTIESFPAPILYLPGEPVVTTPAPSSSTQPSTTTSITTPTTTVKAPTTTQRATSSTATTRPSTIITSTSKPNNAPWRSASLTITLAAFIFLQVL